MKLFGSLRWDGGTCFFYKLKGGGGGGLRSTALHIPSFRHSGRSDKNQYMGSSLEDVDARESVWPAGLAKAKYQEF